MKIKMPITEGIARFCDTSIDSNYKSFDELAKIADTLGYNIKSNENLFTWLFGMLTLEVFYCFEVFEQSKASKICDLVESFLDTFKNDKVYVFGTVDEPNRIDISNTNILGIYKVYELIYYETLEDYLQNESSIFPPYLMICTLITELTHTNNPNVLSQIYDKISPIIKPNIHLWEILNEKIEYEWGI